MQGEVFYPFDAIIPAPPITGTIRSGTEQSVKHGQKDRSFHLKGKLPSLQKALEDLIEMEFLPEPFEDEGRPDLLGGGLGIPLAGEDQKDLFREAGKGTDQVFDLTPFLQVIQASHREEDTLDGSFSLSAVLDDLEILMGSGFLDAGEQGMPPF
jgi:hypothetical protein